MNISNLSKQAGLFEAPPQMVKAIYKWARERICGKVWSNIDKQIRKLTNDGTIPVPEEHDEELTRLNLLKKECQKYASWPWPTSRAQKAFNIDFAGWKYVKDQESLSNFLKTKTLGKITVVLAFIKGHPYAGTWITEYNTLQLFFNDENVISNEQNIINLDSSLKELYGTIRHELQHLGQSYLQLVPQLLEGSNTQFNAGFPSPDIQNKIRTRNLKPGEKPQTNLPIDPKVETEIIHPLRDIEFYTNLTDNIDTLKTTLGWYPKSTRWEIVRAFIDPTFKPTFKQKIVDDYSRKYMLEQMVVSRFFNELFLYEPEKYKKAVKELIKEVSKDFDLEDNKEDESWYPTPPGQTPIFGNSVATYWRYRSWELKNAMPGKNVSLTIFIPQIIKEYDNYVKALTPQQLEAHKNAVEKEGKGKEYYVTDRWRNYQARGALEAESPFDVMADHPKLSSITRLNEFVKIANYCDANNLLYFGKCIDTWIEKISKWQYYDASGIPVKEVLRRWAIDRDKTYDDVVMVSIDELWPYREYTWSKDNFRLKGHDDNYWDTLKRSIVENGWQQKNPAHVIVGKNGQIKIGEGNHRLAIARELGIKDVPVRYHFYENVEKSTQY